MCEPKNTRALLTLSAFVRVIDCASSFFTNAIKKKKGWRTQRVVINLGLPAQRAIYMGMLWLWLSRRRWESKNSAGNSGTSELYELGLQVLTSVKSIGMELAHTSEQETTELLSKFSNCQQCHKFWQKLIFEKLKKKQDNNQRQTAGTSVSQANHGGVMKNKWYGCGGTCSQSSHLKVYQMSKLMTFSHRKAARNA
jgi:hypothetical protein